jgi:exopolysaccharide production protein ExoY
MASEVAPWPNGTTTTTDDVLILPDGGALIVLPDLERAWSTRLRDGVQRGLDILLSAAALLLLVPIMLVVAAFVMSTSPGPVLFGHERVGRGGRHFTCLKFRTMRTDAQEVLAGLLASRPELAAEFAATQKLREDPRVTRIGMLLRRYSLDELPQFYNVLRGDMSIVGPRPVTRPELAYYGPHVSEVLSVRPGITGLWQVSGRSTLTFEQRVELDLAYIRDRRLRTDLAITLRTIRHVVRPDPDEAC